MGYTSEPPNQAEQPKAKAEKERLEEIHTRKQPDIARIDVGISEDEVVNFVRKFLQASNKGNVDNLLEVYADSVDFYGTRHTKDEIRQDKERYYSGWPEVNNQLDGKIIIKDRADKNEREIRFPIKFHVGNPKNKTDISGTAENILILRRIDGNLEIISEKQNVVQRERHH
jgi:hypothetical protein